MNPPKGKPSVRIYGPYKSKGTRQAFHVKVGNGIPKPFTATATGYAKMHAFIVAELEELTAQREG